MNNDKILWLIVGLVAGYAIATYTQKSNGKPAYIQGGAAAIQPDGTPAKK